MVGAAGPRTPDVQRALRAIQLPGGDPAPQRGQQAQVLLGMV